jgi:beta-exotoxin I transport system permease protein
MPEVLRRAIADRRRTLLTWSFGTAAYIAMIAAVFPSIKGSKEFEQLGKSYPDVLKHLFGMTGTFNITTGPGYFDTELFSAMLPLFVVAMVIGAGSGTLAGEHEQGLLELVLARPVSRRSVVLWKALGLGIEIAVMTGAIVLAILIADPIVGLSLERAHVAGATLGLALLGAFHGSMALAVGAATRHKASAIGVPSAVAAMGYLVAGLAGLANWLSPFRYLSAFHYSGQAPLQNGVDGPRLLVLFAGTVVLLALAIVLFERRDLAGT